MRMKIRFSNNAKIANYFDLEMKNAEFWNFNINTNNI